MIAVNKLVVDYTIHGFTRLIYIIHSESIVQLPHPLDSISLQGCFVSIAGIFAYQPLTCNILFPEKSTTISKHKIKNILWKSLCPENSTTPCLYFSRSVVHLQNMITWLTLPKWQGNKSENGYWAQVHLSENGYLAHVSWFKQSHYNTTQS